MDPGARRDKIQVFYRNQVRGDFGSTFTITYQGSFWASVREVTRSLFYSGDEGFNTNTLRVLEPEVIFTFQMDYKFDHEIVEFHIEDEIYVPRDVGIRCGSTRKNYFSYVCKRQLKRQKANEEG